MRPLILAIGIAACGGTAGDTATGIDLSSADLANGQAVHDTSCQICHASNPSMAEYSPSLSDSQLYDVIVDGIGAMPAQSSLSEQDVIDVIAYIRETY